MLSILLPLMPKLRLSGAIQLLPLHILMEWTEQCSANIFLLINSLTTFEIGIFSFHNKRCFSLPLYSRLLWKSMIHCTWISVIFLFFLPSSSHLSALSSVSSTSLSISTLLCSLCLFSIYSSLFLFYTISCSSSPIKYVLPTIMCQQWSRVTHVTP